MNSNSNHPKVRTAAILACVAPMLGGCYLLGQAAGQLALMAKREPIARVMARPTTPPALRAQLAAVTAIRDFASHELALPDNGSYREYADVGRPYAVWNVVAAAEFSVDPLKWCYPIVGCVAYRGYFVESRARAFAAGLRARHFDVSVGGVAAYSTLGHFDDPVLSTMVEWDDVQLAGIIFHELTHQLLYVAGDASFDEALATTVEEEGVRRWLLAQGRAADLAALEQQQDRYLEVIALLRDAGNELRAIYASRIDASAMREGKRAVLAALGSDYARLKSRWKGDAPFAAWFQGEINNAQLASIATYYDCVPGLRRELAAQGGNLREFYQRAFALAALDRAVRAATLCDKV